jgi:hypothetical protein
VTWRGNRAAWIHSSDTEEEFAMAKIRFQIAPDAEFRMDLEVAGIDTGSRDYDIQQHKAEVYKEFERRLNEAFPEGVRIDRFEFGLCLDSES